MPVTSSTSSSDRLMLLAVRVVGVLAAVTFLVARFPSWTAFVSLGRDANGGDLYQMARVSDFREPMAPESISPGVYGAPPESAEVVLIGDSHTRFTRSGKSLAMLLHERFPGLRSCAVTVIHPRFFDPSDLLRLQRIRKGTVKLVLWESAERGLSDVVEAKIPQSFHAWDTTVRFAKVQALRGLNERWFTGAEAGYQFLLSNSILTRSPVEVWNTARFRVTGTMKASIGAWTLSPAHLFLAEELSNTPLRPGEAPTSFLQTRDSARVERMADILAEASKRLREDFGAQLVVVGVPAKASLLHERLGLGYDGFLPRFTRAMNRRGVRAVDAWSGLRSLGERAVLRTETHLSPQAYEALADSLAKAALETVPGLARR